MKAAYIDTSCLVAIAFAEPGSRRILRLLGSYDDLLSSNLLEAELRSALRRENATKDPAEMISGIKWVHPDRPLTEEITTVLETGYVRGADLWHLAVAIFVAPERDIDFLTLDARQREVARDLGMVRA